MTLVSILESKSNIRNEKQLKENFNHWNKNTLKGISFTKVNENEIACDLVKFDMTFSCNKSEADAPNILVNNKKENHDSILKRKYFNIWQKRTEQKKYKLTLMEKKIDTNRKLDDFVTHLKQKRKQFSQTKPNSANNDQPVNSKNVKQISKSARNYKNRFTAQKNIIETQKAKINEQTKLIEELKLGIIREDLLKSIDNTKTDIRAIFANCSERLKIKAPLIMAVEEREKFMLTTQKVPKVVQKMEQRAIERFNNRQVILERKRLIKETRQKLLEEAILKKKALEEDERKRYLELIKEQRKKELEKEKARQVMKQIYLEKENKAVQFHNTKLLRTYFKHMRNKFLQRKNSYATAEQFYNNKILKTTVNAWIKYVEQKYSVMYQIADAHYEYKLLRAAVKDWKELRIENIRSRQVAEDVYDFRLTSNTFSSWHRLVCKQLNLRDKKMKIAICHHTRRLLFQCFYQWRSLPAVIQLEKAKEEKKRKWREKVWEILPDYRPPNDM